MPAYSDILTAHQREALDRLICGDMHDLDPCIGDVSCQMRVPFILDAYWKVHSRLRERGLLDCIYEAIKQPNGGQQAARHNVDGTVEGQLAALRAWRQYDDTVTDIRQLLGEKTIELLGLCYSLTFSNALSYDEFGTCFYFVYLGSFGPPSHHHDSHRKLGPDNQLPILRQKLASGIVAYFHDVVGRLVAASTHTTREVKQGDFINCIEQQLYEAVHRLSSRIEQQYPHADSIPLVACQPQMRVVLLHEFACKRPMVVTVRRLKIVNCSVKGLIYTLSDTRCLYYTPSEETGVFELVNSVDNKFRNIPCLSFNCWSTYLDSQPGRGLDSSSDAEYFHALAQSDISWLIVAYSNVHPPFASKSDANGDDLRSTYANICGAEVRSFDYTRERCHGFDLQRQRLEEKRPTLYEELVMAVDLGQRHNFANARLLPMGARFRNCYVRIGHAVDFAVEHVNVSTLGRAESFCMSLRSRHASASQAVIGQFVVRIGRCGVSCTDEGFARSLGGIKHKNKKWGRYASRYAQNLMLCIEFSNSTL
ncbi:hypothetical protein ISF_09790 [Cordyceps fumosorosea ARSEF 2679]|uniref:Uncharacterized protein n=1 Tax=Cordyceps fumosorosea (strain ARSEF 2679) TaxID=1081104 RepID=A0A167C8L8_CORFA|nr:hypothetical protein ISF_09790 [Cordyceps fumosorosea ARSEF 2679]OAA40901.1 hypothetical protein ISF_09790 [Cordyceps fumosorosea ARSEF 2679]